MKSVFLTLKGLNMNNNIKHRIPTLKGLNIVKERISLQK